MVSTRRSLLDYVKQVTKRATAALIARLGIRR
jgi:ribosomal protein S15P/S13E